MDTKHTKTQQKNWKNWILLEYPTILILTLIPNPSSNLNPNPNPNKMVGYSTI